MTSTVRDHPYYVRYTGVAWSACPKGFRTGSPKGFNDMCHFCLGCNILSHPERPERAFKPEVPRIHEDFQLGCANEKPFPNQESKSSLRISVESPTQESSPLPRLQRVGDQKAVLSWWIMDDLLGFTGNITNMCFAGADSSATPP